MKVILTLAALGLSVAGANACDYMKSAEAQVDTTVVASVTPAPNPAMSTADDALAPLPQVKPVVEQTN